jgi:glutamine amidotransferase
LDSLYRTTQAVTNLVLSHIRHATQGGISLANTQPFLRELGGRMHVFAHNGSLDGIKDRTAGQWQRFQPLGETDSEIAFCILLQRLSPLWSAGVIPALEARLPINTHFAAEMRDMGPANFLYTDGDALFAHAHRRVQADGKIAPPGLWRLRRRCALDTDALSISAPTIEEGGRELTLIASVPLTEGPWSSFAEGELVVIKQGRIESSRTP